MVKATFTALQKCASPRSVATRRGKKVPELFGRRDTPPPAASAPAASAPAASAPAAPAQEGPANG
jgi:small subunit ribosomal protein S5